MMKMKRMFFVMLGLVLVLNLTGCTKPAPKQLNTIEEFNTYVEKLPEKMIDNDDFNLEYMFENPSNYGFKEEILKLPYSDEKDFKESKKEIEQIIKELKQFEYYQLTDSQKLTYDILMDSFTRSLTMFDYYYLATGYLGSFTSFQAQLPLLLSEYTFEHQNDLDSYFNILSTSEETFLKYAEIEKDRQAHNSGLAKNILNKTIEQCQNYTKDDDNYLIERINQRIDQIDFLNESEKQLAKQKNQELVTTNLKQAYQSLETELKKIKVTNSDNLGVYASPKGKDYYQALLKNSVGTDMSVKEVKKYLTDKITTLSTEAGALITKNPELQNITSFEDFVYSDFISTDQTLDYLKTAIAKDYPHIDNLNYEIITVPEAWKDNFSPAAYLQGKIDAPIDTPELIYINGEYSQGLFNTIMHEGYPGHMYQHTYFKQQKDLPLVRHMVISGGYSEGWAQYVELNGYKYAPVEDKTKLQLKSLNEKVAGVCLCIMDIGINYDGWSFDDYLDFCNQVLGTADKSVLQDQYDLLLENPTYYLKYFLSEFLFEDLYNKANKELGDKFSLVDFHDVILSTGPTSFPILQKQVNKYISNHK